MFHELKRTQLVAAIVNFLLDEVTSFDKEDAEGIQVAISCLRHSYKLEETDLQASEVPNLKKVFKVPEASPSFLPKEKKLITEEMRAEAEMHKSRGNEHLQAKRATEAEEEYTRALELDSENPIYYSNRAAAYMLLEDYKKALEDCRAAVALDPTYAKGYSRLGAAQLALGNTQKAIEAYSKAVELEPDNVGYHSSLDKAKRKLPSTKPTASNDRPSTGTNGPRGASPFGGGSGPGGLDLSSLLNNPEIMNMAAQMMNNPDAMRNMFNDPNMAAMMQGMMRGAGTSRNASAHRPAGSPPPAKEEP